MTPPIVTLYSIDASSTDFFTQKFYFFFFSQTDKLTQYAYISNKYIVIYGVQVTYYFKGFHKNKSLRDYNITLLIIEIREGVNWYT